MSMNNKKTAKRQFLVPPSELPLLDAFRRVNLDIHDFGIIKFRYVFVE